MNGLKALRFSYELREAVGQNQGASSRLEIMKNV
jgi:hypothetical protein